MHVPPIGPSPSNASRSDHPLLTAHRPGFPAARILLRPRTTFKIQLFFEPKAQAPNIFPPTPLSFPEQPTPTLNRIASPSLSALEDSPLASKSRVLLFCCLFFLQEVASRHPLIVSIDSSCLLNPNWAPPLAPTPGRKNDFGPLARLSSAQPNGLDRIVHSSQILSHHSSQASASSPFPLKRGVAGGWAV